MRNPAWGSAGSASFVILIGCSSAYAPVTELWPTSSTLSNGGDEAGSANDGNSPPPVEASMPPVSFGLDAALTTTEAGDFPTYDAGAPPPDDATPPLDAPADDAMPTTEAGPALGGSCSLSVSMTTVTDNGDFDPANVGAIWIADASGAFIKTLALWAQTRVSRLNLWNQVTTAAGSSRNTVDAITSATLYSHQTHNVKWTCTNTKRAVVPNGAYRVYFEMADSNSGGPNAHVDFMKGSTSQTLTPPDFPNFTKIKLVFVP